MENAFYWAGAVALGLGSQAIAEPVSMLCTFDRFHSPENFVRRAVSDFTLTFVRTGPETATVLGNNGSNEVAVVEGYAGTTFLEVLISGAVQTTTVTLNMDAVHSRHTVIGGELVPTQYYGTCRKR